MTLALRSMLVLSITTEYPLRSALRAAASTAWREPNSSWQRRLKLGKNTSNCLANVDCKFDMSPKCYSRCWIERRVDLEVRSPSLNPRGRRESRLLAVESSLKSSSHKPRERSRTSCLRQLPRWLSSFPFNTRGARTY